MSFSSTWLKAEQAKDEGGEDESASLLGSARSFMGRLSATAQTGLAGVVGGSGTSGDFGSGSTGGGGDAETGGGGGSSWMASAASAVGLAPAAEPEPSWICFRSCDGLSRAERFKVFVIGILLSAAILGFAFVVTLPVMVFFPAKFALSFTLGSIVFLSSFAILEGPTSFIRRMATRERAPFAIIYVGSMALTLYSSLVWRYYIIVVIAAGTQMVSLLLFGASFVPGGQLGLSYAFSAFKSTAMLILRPCLSKLTG